MAGTLQYNKDYDIIKNLVIPLDKNYNQEGWTLETHSEENLKRLTSNTTKGKKIGKYF
jgi:hypothetical protein